MKKIINGREFILHATGKRIHLKSELFVGDLIYYKDPDTSNISTLGFAYDEAHAKRIVEDYFGFSLCRRIGFYDVFSPWCIRSLIDGKRKNMISHWGKNNTASLCGRVKINYGVDMVAPVDLDHNRMCDECAWIYWQESLKHGTT